MATKFYSDELGIQPWVFVKFGEILQQKTRVYGFVIEARELGFTLHSRPLHKSSLINYLNGF